MRALPQNPNCQCGCAWHRHGRKAYACDDCTCAGYRPRLEQLLGGTPFAHAIAEIVAMHDRKQADYGADEDPFANVRASEDFGIPGWVGCMTRANDKMKRLQKAAKGGPLANEGIEDSLLDLAVYAIIGLVLFREQ